MKKQLILLMLSLLMTIPCISQTIQIDSIQAKQISLIFTEHEKLSKENPLLKEKILSLETLNSLYEESDSLQKEEINVLQDKVVSNNKKIKKLKTSRNLSYVGGIVLFIIGLLL